MLKNFLLKKTLQAQMKHVPPEQQEMLMRAIEKNPELFQKIATEVKKKMDAGTDQMTATMSVMQKYQTEIKEAML